MISKKEKLLENIAKEMADSEDVFEIWEECSILYDRVEDNSIPIAEGESELFYLKKRLGKKHLNKQ